MNGFMTSEDDSATKVDLIRAKVAPAIMHEPLFETAVALSLLMAHTVLHDGGNEDDVVSLARAAYRRAAEVHEKCRCDA
jgi:hypothetical protein